MEWDIYHRIILWLCVAGLAVSLPVLLALKVAFPVWDAVRRWLSLPRIQQFVVAAFVICMIQYGSTKGWYIRYDGGISAGSNPSWVTNDTIHIEWQRDTSGGVYVPESAAVYIDYRSNTETNAEWGLLAQATVGDWHWDGTLDNATNYDFNVWAYYIPPEPVHTNGVWVYKTLRDRGEKYPIPLRARIELNGKAIATPKEKRKDEDQ